MYNKLIKPLILLRSLSTDLGMNIALSPTQPLIADTGYREKVDLLRIVNYQTSTELKSIPIPCTPHTIAFSPDGTRLFMMPGGSGCWRALQVYSEPWDSPQLLFDGSFQFELYHGAWLDNDTILIASRKTDGNNYNDCCILTFSVSTKAFKVIHEGWPFSSSTYVSIESAICSPSGQVAYVTDYGRKILLFQLDLENACVREILPVSPPHNSYGATENFYVSFYDQVLVKLAEKTYATRNHLFYHARRGSTSFLDELICSLDHGVQAAFCKDNFLCIRVSNRSTKDNELHIYDIANAALHSSNPDTGYGGYLRAVDSSGIDLTRYDDRVILAVVEEGYSQKTIKISELVDFFIFRLTSDDAGQRLEAVNNLGERRFKRAVPYLIHLLQDPVPDIRAATATALIKIGDAEPLPFILRALGEESDDRARDQILSSVLTFDESRLTSAVLTAIEQPAVASRRGAARTLEAAASIPALEALCKAAGDEDRFIRLSAIRALRLRADPGACVALLPRLNDDDKEVRVAAQAAALGLLTSNGLAWDGLEKELSVQLDLEAYAQAAISAGRTGDFQTFGEPRVGRFLESLAGACVRRDQPLPQLLDSLDLLAVNRGVSFGPAPSPISLVMALACADALKRGSRWAEAISLYRTAASLASRLEAPQAEWRIWYAAGECYERLKKDPGALNAYQEAMGVIDRLWFALLEEDKLRDFFREKALLYDRALLCCLRLGYSELALEYLEKAKARYLGDLIARKQLAPQAVLEREERDFWENLARPKPLRVAADPASPSAENVEIVSVLPGQAADPGNAIVPEQWAAFEKVRGSGGEEDLQRTQLLDIWLLVSRVAELDDYTVNQRLEDLYQALSPIHSAIKTGALPVNDAVQQRSIQAFKGAARAFHDAVRDRVGNEDTSKSWLFSEYWRLWEAWIGGVCLSTRAGKSALFIEAAMEAFNSVLHHEAVLGVPDENRGSQRPAIRFLTRTLDGKTASPGRTTATVNSYLERQTRGRWRYLARLVRGDTVRYSDIERSLGGKPHTAQLHFSVTESGTVVFVIYGKPGTREPKGDLPDLRGERDLEVYSVPEVTLRSLRRRLIRSDDGWFASYQKWLGGADRLAWLRAMDKTYQWLYKHLIAPLDSHLKSRDIRHLEIIPNRALNTIPFSALSYLKSGRPRYLADDYTLGHAPSATLKDISRERLETSSLRHGLTAFSNPTGDLPFTTWEADGIAALFSASAQVWDGPLATRENLLAAGIGAIFHFSGHARYCWEDPLESRLQFADEAISLQDLFAEKIDLRGTSLAVLSACETNLTDPEDLSDECLGITGGFMFAGAPIVLSSLWTVDDISSALLMTCFYKQLAQRRTPGRALKLAQAWLREVDRETVIQLLETRISQLEAQPASGQNESDSDYPLGWQIANLLRRRDLLLADARKGSGDKPFAHPYFWAGFTVSGSDDAIPGNVPGKQASHLHQLSLCLKNLNKR